MKKLLIFLSLFLTYPTQATSIDDQFKIRLGGYLVARNDTILSATSEKLIGSRVNLQDDLGMDLKTTSFRVDSYYRFNPAHKIEFAYYNIKASSSKVIENDIEWNGSTFNAGGKVNSHLYLNIYKLNYVYSFYHNDKVELGLATGLHMMETKAGLSGSATKDDELVAFADESVDFLAPLPVLGFRLDYAITPRFHMGGAIDYFGLSIDKYSGSFMDLLISAEYQVYENFGAGIGLNFTSLDVKIDKGIKYEIDQSITGVLAYVSYHY